MTSIYASVLVSIRIFEACRAAGIPVGMESPYHSYLWLTPEIKALIEADGSVRVAAARTCAHARAGRRVWMDRRVCVGLAARALHGGLWAKFGLCIFAGVEQRCRNLKPKDQTLQQ